MEFVGNVLMTNFEEKISRAEKQIKDLWDSLRDGFSPHAGHYVSGYLKALHDVGLLSEDECELWANRL